MGCGKSKHDVVTGNTVSQKKKPSADVKKDGETAIEKASDSTSATSPVAPQGTANSGLKGSQDAKADVGVTAEGSQNASANPSGGAAQESGENAQAEFKGAKAKEGEKVAVAEDVKVASQEIEGMKDGHEANMVKEGVVEGKGQSPNDFPSSAKEEETVEGLISEGLSGKTEFFSPVSKEGVLGESAKANNVVEEQGSIVEAKTESTTEGEAINATDRDLVKEDVVPPVEASAVSINNEVEKIPTSNEEVELKGK